MMCPRVALPTVFIGCLALLINYCQQAESVSSNEIDSDSNAYTAQSKYSRSSPVESSNQHTSKILKPSQIRNRRSNSLINSDEFNEDVPGLDSAFLYSDQIMQNLLNSQSPRPLNYARSNFFLNLLKPRTTRFNSWDDHSLMHFGKRSTEDDKSVVKRSTDSWGPDNVLHFGKKSGQDKNDQNSRLLNMEFPNFGTELVEDVSANEDIEHASAPVDVYQNGKNDAETENVEKKTGDPWHNMMSFGKKSENSWDHSTLHFGKKDEPWHNMMSFGKKFDNQWDQNILHFGKREDPWHSMMSFGKKSEPWHNIMSFGKRSENPWDHSTLHFGKRDEPWHNMMSFGKKFDNQFDQNIMHFGKRDDPWHNMMSFGKKSEFSNNNDTIIDDKRNDPWHNVVSFGKKSDDNFGDHLTLHFGKREEPWHNVMSFGKKSENPWDHSTLHFGKREEPWHSTLNFGKKSDNPWDHSTLHFGKRDEPWHNMMSFGKKSENPWDHSTLHFGKREEPWHNMMSFGKKSDNPWDHSTLHFGKREDPWHNMMSFGKKLDNSWDHNTLHFGKRDEPWHNMMSFGKKSENLWDHNTLHFGKRDEPWHSMMSFGKKSETPWDHSTLHFGKKDEPWHSMMSFGKRSEGIIANDQEDSLSHMIPLEDDSAVIFYKKPDPREHSTLHFSKRSNDSSGSNLFEQKTSDLPKNVRKRSIDEWNSHHALHFGKRTDLLDEDTLESDKKSDWDAHNTLHFGKKRNPWEYHNTMHFGKRDPWENHNTLHFGKRNPWDNHNTMHFGKRDPWDNHNTMHFGKRNPWESHNTMHFGKRDSWESHNTMHFGKRSDSVKLNEVKETGQSLQSSKSEKNENELQHSIINKETPSNFQLKDYSESAASESNNKAPVNKRSTEYIDKNVNFKNRENENKIRLVKNRSSQDSSKASLEDNKQESNNIYGQIKDQEESALIDNQVNRKQNDIIRHSIKTTESINKVASQFPTLVNEEAVNRIKTDEIPNNEKLIQMSDYIGVSENDLKSRINKRSAKTDSLMENGEKYENNDSNERSNEEYSANNIPETVLHFGKRSLDDLNDNFAEIGAENLPIEDKRYDDWDNHNTLHFGKRDSWDHSTLHFGKRNPWDHSTMHFGKRDPWDHGTMHFGKRNPWDHSAMHFGKRSPWDHNTMHFGKKFDPWEGHQTMNFGKRSDNWDHNTLHFGKREENANDDGTDDLFTFTHETQKFKDLLDKSILQGVMKNSNFNFPEDISNLEKNDELLDYIPDTEINKPVNNQNIYYSSKYNILKSYLKPILRNALIGQDKDVVLSYPEDLKEDDVNAFDQYRHEDLSKLNYDNLLSLLNNNNNFGEKGLPEENEEENGESISPSHNLLSYLTDYKSKRNYLGKSELKRYFGPFQGPKSIVYPHAWFASQIRRSSMPKNTDFTRSFDLRMAEKKEDPFNSYMHFGRR